MSVKARNRVWLACVLFLIVASLTFLGFYRADGDVILATSSDSVEEVAAAMNNTKYIRFVEDLGVRRSKTLFSYRWENFTFFEIFSCIGEMRRLSKELAFVVVRE